MWFKQHEVILLHTEKVQIGNECWNSGSIKSSRTQDPSALSFCHPYFILARGLAGSRRKG